MRQLHSQPVPGDSESQLAAWMQRMEERVRTLETTPRLPQITNTLTSGQAASVSTQEVKTDITWDVYADLPSFGPQIVLSMEGATKALVAITSRLGGGETSAAYMSFEVSGGASVPASDDRAIFSSMDLASAGFTGFFLIEDIAEGVETTFTAKYRKLGPGIARWWQRYMIVIPL